MQVFTNFLHQHVIHLVIVSLSPFVTALPTPDSQLQANPLVCPAHDLALQFEMSKATPHVAENN
jgi:hypothetical protein